MQLNPNHAATHHCLPVCWILWVTYLKLSPSNEIYSQSNILECRNAAIFYSRSKCCSTTAVNSVAITGIHGGCYLILLVRSGWPYLSTYNFLTSITTRNIKQQNAPQRKDLTNETTKLNNDSLKFSHLLDLPAVSRIVYRVHSLDVSWKHIPK
jgi:hypothetical protein